MDLYKFNLEKIASVLHSIGLPIEATLASQNKGHEEGKGSCNTQPETSLQELH